MELVKRLENHENDQGRNALLRIRRKLPKFSPTQRKIAEFIMNDCSDAVRMSSHGMAKKLGVSASTVVRFALEMGYRGFREMLDDLRTAVWTYSQLPMKKIRESIDGDEAPEGCLLEAVEHGIKNLSIQKFLPVNESFLRVVDRMTHAGNVYLIGARSSFCVVHYGGFTLSTVAKNVHFFSSSIEDRYERLTELSEKDVICSISFHRYYRDTVELTAFAKGKGAFVSGVTDSIFSPIAEYCDELLLVPNEAPFLSYLPAMVLMDAICSAFIRSKGKEAEKLLDDRMEVLLQNNVYTELRSS